MYLEHGYMSTEQTPRHRDLCDFSLVMGYRRNIYDHTPTQEAKMTNISTKKQDAKVQLFDGGRNSYK